LEDRRVALELISRSAARKSDELRDLVSQAFELSSKAGEVFTVGTPVQKRAILELVGLNYRMEGKTLRFSWRKPFSLLADRPQRSIGVTSRRC
jgi:hypothetical protein